MHTEQSQNGRTKTVRHRLVGLQIREQMCLQTHFQDEFSILGSQGCREKKNPNCHKYATFEASFLCFHGQKKNI